METNEKGNIVVVEDEAITAMDIQRRLSKIGYAVPAITPSGEEAVLLAKDIKPNLILMDISLQGEIDGTVAAQEISRQYNIPIIFITAYKDDETFNRAMLSAPYSYLTKPFETSELRFAVELALFKHDIYSRLMIAEKRYRLLMDNASCGFLVHDSRGMILEVNKQAERILGNTKDYIIGNDIRSIFTPEDQEYASIKLEKLRVEKNIETHEAHALLPNGTIKDIEISGICVNIGNNDLFLRIINDVTERNRLRHQMLLSDKLATIGTLSAGIIHEINNPMAWILINLDLIKRQIETHTQDKPDPSNLLNDIGVIIDESLEGVNKIKDIVSNLKGFSRVDQSELTTINIHDILNAAINISAPQLKSVARLEKKYMENLPDLFLNNNRLEQVFINLIINAAQAFEQKNIEINFIQISTNVENNNIRIDISDNAKGIPKNILPQIFEPFFTTKPVGIGTGLGLSICHDIVYSLGGHINVDSTVGKGTTFSIYVPMKISMVNVNSNDSAFSEMLTNKKILLVDDDPTSLVIFKRIIGDTQNIVTAQSGRSAIELLKTSTDEYDLIISDLYMPDVDGSDLYRYVSRNHPGLEKRIIFMSGGEYTDAINDFITHIQNDCLKKPFTSDELLNAITNMVKE